MENCCDSLLKYLVFFFNFLFVITGIALIGMGAYIQIAMKHYLDFLGDSYFNTSIVLIIIGVVIFVIAFFGCCGACTENACMMYTFGALLLLIFVTEVGLAIAIYVFKGDVREIITGNMKEGMQHYGDDPTYAGVVETWNIIQSDLQCCGVDQYSDWGNYNASHDKHDVPDSCCKTQKTDCGKGQLDNPTQINTEGCFKKLESYVVDNVAIVGGVGVGVALIQIVGIIVACCLARNMKREYNYV